MDLNTTIRVVQTYFYQTLQYTLSKFLCLNNSLLHFFNKSEGDAFSWLLSEAALFLKVSFIECNILGRQCFTQHFEYIILFSQSAKILLATVRHNSTAPMYIPFLLCTKSCFHSSSIFQLHLIICLCVGTSRGERKTSSCLGFSVGVIKQ